VRIKPADTAEGRRLEDNNRRVAHWNRWGPYLSERAWGTVREDYSADGSAWDSFPHDHARSRAYRWNEDGLGGICDRHQLLCFAIALWNGKDPILKERPFGLTNSEGNHGEDVKEYWFYLDSTPTHSYMKYLYKYPHAEYPYGRLLEENRRRTIEDPEYELLDTGIFAESRYCDVFIEYAKATPEDVLVEITVANRGPELATLDLLPTAWFRNTWSWRPGRTRPLAAAAARKDGSPVVTLDEAYLGRRYLHVEPGAELLFTDAERLFGAPNPSPYVKDAFHEYVVHGKTVAVNPAQRGTKAAARHRVTVPAGASVRVRVRLTDAPWDAGDPLGEDFDRTLALRRSEADAFYAATIPERLSVDEKNVMRQAFAGMLWSKQFYKYDVRRWLDGDPLQPPPPGARVRGRNRDWRHVFNADVLSMPDTWEFPWFAAWDLAFHCVVLSLVDVQFAKDQLVLILREWYMHPNGQIPAYEWNFGDVNPPVHAWAALRVFQIEKAKTGKGDRAFLERVFHKLLLNFDWWVNRKDELGNNIFQGGFLGLDNIGIFDRNMKLPEGWILSQADGTSWMATYCLNLLGMALELASEDPVYEDVASKFWEHFVYIAHAIQRPDDPGPLGRGAPAPDRGRYRRFAAHQPLSRLQAPDGLVLRAPAGPDGLLRLDDAAWAARTAPHVRREAGAARARPEVHARRVGVPLALRHPLRLPVPPRPPVRRPGARPGLSSRLRARRIAHRALRRQLELARADLVPDQLPDPRVAQALPPLLRRRVPDRVPHGLGKDDDAARGLARARPATLPDFPARRRGAASRLRRLRGVPERPALEGPHPFPRVLQRRHRQRSRREPPDRMDGARREAAGRVGVSRDRPSLGHAPCGSSAWEA
jgi:hypothetical protein